MATAGSPGSASGRLDPALLRMAAALLTGVLAVVFDTTIVSVALIAVILALWLVARVILLTYIPSLSGFANAAVHTAGRGTAVNQIVNVSPVVHSGIAVLLLIVATTLSVYKPRGTTRYGHRLQHKRGRIPA